MKVATSDLIRNGHLNLQINRPDLLPSGNILPVSSAKWECDET
jgi:hypothetical protein